MANWSNPVLSSTYTTILDDLKNRDIDAAVMFSPTYSTATNLSAGTVRWNPTNGYFEIYSGTAWSALISKYLIDVDKLDGQDGSYYLAWGNLTGVPSTFTPSTHTHDDRYFTETEADARFANKLVVSSNSIKLQTFAGVDLATITVPYATQAGNAATAGGYSVGQNLLTTSAVTFASLTTTGSLAVEGSTITLGDSGDLNPSLEIWDNTGLTYRSLRWTSSISEWQVEDSTGTLRRLYHEGHVPDWSELSGKPTTFAPSAHGHSFDATNKGVAYIRTNTQMASYTGSAGELVYNSTNKRLHTHDGTTAGGSALALLSDIPSSPDLSGYALLASNTFTGGQTMPTIRLTTTSAVGLTSTGHGFQLGPSTDINLAVDINTIQVRNNGAAGTIGINPYGGSVNIGNSSSTITLNGILSASSSAAATVTEAQAGLSTNKFMTPFSVRTAIKYLPRLTPLLALTMSNNTTYTITDLPVNATIHFYFSALKASITTNPNILRFATSTTNGASFNTPYNFTEGRNWNTTGVFGRLTLLRRGNPISGLTCGFSYTTGNSSLGVANPTGEFPDDPLVLASTNAVQFSFSAGGSLASGKIFVFAEYDA